jgi:hypothetical protein
MTFMSGIQSSVSHSANLRRWISRAFVVSILVYLVVVGYLLTESVRGASKWAPYGVNMPVFISLIIASEVIITLTAVWIFREDAGIWPASVARGWREFRSGKISGLGSVLTGAWDVSIVDLRLRTRTAIGLGRVNRIAALAPLIYALAASANRPAPWGLRASALVDIGLTLAVWAFMEAVMVRPEAAPASEARASATTLVAPTVNGVAKKASRYEVRRVSRADIARVAEIEHIKWRDQAATRDVIEARLNRYPQGQVAAVHQSVVAGEVASRTLVAWCTVMPTSEERVRSIGSWDEVTDGGRITSADPRGDVLVGVNLTSVTEGATYMLLGEILASVVAWGKKKMIGGGRLNGFVSFNEHRAHEQKAPVSADAYARLREIRGFRLNERRLDEGLAPLDDNAYVELANRINAVNGLPALEAEQRPDYVCANVRGYMSIPGARLVRVAPNYFPDAASDNWGVIIDWTNPLPAPLRHLPLFRNLVAMRIRQEVRAEWEARKRRVHEAARQRAARRLDAAPAQPELVAAT